MHVYFFSKGNFREDNFQKSMAVILEGTGAGSQKGRKGGTKGNENMIFYKATFTHCD